MTDSNQSVDLLNLENEPKVLPGTLSVLTILTFIGSGLGVIGAIYGYVKAPDAYQKAVEAQAQVDNGPSALKAIVGSHLVENASKSLENRVAILIMTLLSIALCVYGALKMRSLKKEGFAFYAIGEILPLIGSFFLIGAGAFSGFGLLGVVIPVVFVVLYASQIKHLS